MLGKNGTGEMPTSVAEETPKKKLLDTKGKKLVASFAAAALVLAGGGAGVWAFMDSTRTTNYDASVTEAQNLAVEIEQLGNDVAEAEYLMVDQTVLFEKQHVDALKRFTTVSDKLVNADSLDALKVSSEELITLYRAPEAKDGEAVVHPFYTGEAFERYTEANDAFKEDQTFAPASLPVPATAPALSGKSDGRVTDVQIAQANAAVEENAKLRDKLAEELDALTAQLDELEARQIADAAVLEPAVDEALEHVNDFIKDWSKAADGPKKALKTATEELQAALDAYRADEPAEPEDADEEVVAEEQAEEEPTIVAAFTFEHEPKQQTRLELAVDMRTSFGVFISKINDYKKSHDEAVAAEAAAAAAAAGAAQYQDPVTGTWTPTPAPTWGGGGGSSWNNGGGSNWNSGGGGGGYTPPATGGGGGGSGYTPPATSGGGGGGGNSGGGNWGPPPVTPPYVCPAQPANTYWGGGTYTVDGVTCKNWIPNGDIEW